MLSGASLRMELPTGCDDAHRRPDTGGIAGDLHSLLSPATVTGLETLSSRNGCNVPELVLLAWMTLVARTCARSDAWVAVADTMAVADGRSLDWWPIHVELADVEGSGAAIVALGQALAAARDHAGLPMARFVEACLPPSGDDGAPPLNIGFAGPLSAVDEGGEKAAGPIEGCDLTLCMGRDEDARWSLSVHGSTYVEQRGLAQRHAAWLERLLAGMVETPAGPPLALALVAPAAIHGLLAKGSKAHGLPAGIARVHQFFEVQAARRPDAVAVVDGARTATYADLNAEANRLARHLIGLGIGRDDRVALYLERRLELVVGVLAVLKAGAAYVPLDPAYPPERLGYTLSDSEPAALLTQSDMPGDWRAIAGEARLDCPVLMLDDMDAPWSAQAINDMPVSAENGPSDDLAYVLYTSGSTGKPKGVAMPHAPLVNLIDWQMRQPGHEAPLRTLQFAALGFDVAFQEIFGTLATGGTLHMIDADTRLSGDRLLDFVVEHRIERLFLPYFALQILAEAVDNRLAVQDATLDCCLKEVVTAGEQLRIEPKIRHFFQRLPGCRLHNHYGPTETHVVTALALPDDPATWPSLPTIGMPIDNARVYLLDDRGQPVPEGVVGELYLAGPVVARGYLKRDDLTRERFLDDPFVAGEDARMYRTGDLGRWRDDGALEFLGRRDSQVKIRGFRVEPGEIEARLMAFPGIREAGVMAREDTPGLKRLVAYFAPRDPAVPVDVDALRRDLVSQLPDYMVPVAYVAMESLPLSPNGKLDRARLPAPDRGRPDWIGEYAPPRDELERALCRILAGVLDLESVGRGDNFFELGGSSLLAIRALQLIRDERVGEPSAIALFQHPTPAMLADALRAQDGEPAGRMRTVRGHRRGRDDDPIAIIAMAGRFPGASDVEQFWRNLCEGRDSISFFDAASLDPAVPAADREDPAYVPARGVIDGVEDFDAAFFGISPREAELMDPQQRIFLELCWECMERAGHVPGADGDGPVGVFAGMYNASYFQHHVLSRPDLVERLGAFQVMLDNEKDYIATRVAHKLNLTGPAISVHTGCSTSLVAIAQAVDGLRAGRCDMALAGGASVTCPPRSGYRYQEGAMFSPDGRTRAFDEKAAGTVFCDGAAVLMLKRLSDALADGDPVHAVIRGVGVNNDGSDKASFTAPSAAAQAVVIAQAHADAGVPARSIGYVEAHGTATPLGDPIEVEGLTRAFRFDTGDTGFCRLGSVKSNVGHLLIAAGAAGVIKTALSLERELIPASLYFESPNPALNLDTSPFVVNAANQPWPRADEPRRAGVSSFGVGGTNAHAVVEEAPERPLSDPAEGPQLLVLSARTASALEVAATRLADRLESTPDANLADVAWTLATGRKAFAHRLAVVAGDAAEAAEILRRAETLSAAQRSRPARGGECVFLFPGQGSTYPCMGRQLHAGEPVFREALETCIAALGDGFGFDLRERLFSDDPEALLPTAVMQPATFAIEYALARWWMAQGLRPAAMIGHSVGEFVAATLAGVFEVGDAIRLVARRGALMQAQPEGRMLSVRLPWEALSVRLPEGLSMAAENAPGASVVAGPEGALSAFQTVLEGEGVACRMLRTSHAFHSSMMEPAVAPFLEAVAAITRKAPTLPIVSTASGDWLQAEEAVSADYWARHLREPVRFSKALSKVIDTPSRVLLEVGPRTALSSLARMHAPVQKQKLTVLATLADDAGAEHALLRNALGQLWAVGVDVDPSRLDRRSVRHRLCLPTYPFERQRCWIEAPAATRPQITSPATDNVVQHPAVVAVQENTMQQPVTPVAAPANRKPRLLAQLRELIEDVAGFDMDDADPQANFIELGLDSLVLTQVALQVQKSFGTRVTFRQLMGDAPTLEALAALLDAQLPPEEAVPPAPAVEAVPVAVAPAPAVTPSVAPAATTPATMPAMQTMQATAPAAGVDGGLLQQVIAQQMQLMSQQLALLSGTTAVAPVPSIPMPAPAVSMPAPAAATSVEPPPTPAQPAATPGPAATDDGDNDAEVAHTRYDPRKAFGAIARIDSSGQLALDERQRSRLDAFIERYVARTPKSKAYTREHRPHMADPRVVNGFRPLTKEIVYQIVIERSKGARMWDIDGNEYVDALNGFGMSLFGWQPDFVADALRRQIDLGLDIGPQHPLAGEVARLVCELTGHDRAALCNTGSEAVLGALRIARTVTGRETVVMFNGSYHGINDEVIVRGTRKLKAVPAAPGILRNTAAHVLVLDYGTPETMAIIRERAGEIAAVLVEPVQSRRPDFRPIEFLKELRQLTADAGAALIFDEVITGFRAHPGGTQAMFGVQADIATYGKVVGGGQPIGVIAGKREFMDALDGGQWDYGDDSVPTVGVTYFAGTFVRHPMALAAARVVLDEMKRRGPALQEDLNARMGAMAAEINAFCASRGAPVEVRHFASVWKTFFLEDHPLQDLLFAMMRSRGIHILDNFPCFLTAAHGEAECRAIVEAFKDSVVELQECGFLPRHAATPATVMDASRPPVPGARIGRDPDGRPGWYVDSAERPGQYVKVG
ncbi:polyketide synthase [Marilutibacter alkalisoli]|uniref:polyketide synthase n=1 Tax=Marilutibacter alkalisoli TaxID=2591633 RepID=UPI0014241019|nr:polyketide synthase [Lysobacter alkalisoli]